MFLKSILLGMIIFHGCMGKDNKTAKFPSLMREGKVFPIFSVVNFENKPCVASVNQRKGVCYTSTDCSAKGGIPLGNCAVGFGICCMFVVSAPGSIIIQNETYLRSPNYPAGLLTTNTLSYTVAKCNPDVCYLRLDFEEFQIVGPTDSNEVANSCPDLLSIKTITGNTIPQICGINTSQHIYVDIGNQPTDEVTLTFSFSTTVTVTKINKRRWEISISQIECSNPSRPPGGCLQYFAKPVGRLSTFNFAATNSAKLNLQNYNICIRQEAGFCCIRYVTCQDSSNPFNINADFKDGPPFVGQTDSECQTSFILVPASGLSCSLNSGNLHTKYCGNYIGPLAASGDVMGVVSNICDCTPPFLVGVITAKTAIASKTNKGVCLDFQQVPCSRV